MEEWKVYGQFFVWRLFKAASCELFCENLVYYKMTIASRVQNLNYLNWNKFIWISNQVVPQPKVSLFMYYIVYWPGRNYRMLPYRVYYYLRGWIYRNQNTHTDTHSDKLVFLHSEVLVFTAGSTFDGHIGVMYICIHRCQSNFVVLIKLWTENRVAPHFNKIKCKMEWPNFLCATRTKSPISNRKL